MIASDITRQRLNTLILVHSLEEFITDEYDNLDKLSDVIYNFEESMSDDEHIRFVEDICKLTDAGYLSSDATGEDMINNIIPEVESITARGKALLDMTGFTKEKGRTVKI